MLAAMLVTARTGAAATYNFVTIDPPGITGPVAFGINNAGQVVGYGSTGSSPFVSFLYSGGTFTLVAYPGAVATELFGINDSGQIVGAYTDSTTQHAFVYHAGIFTPLVVPFGDPGARTQALGINNLGQIVGIFSNTITNAAPYAQGGFLFSAGMYTAIVSSNFFTTPNGINNSGEIVGSASNPELNAFPFTYTSGVFSTLMLPGVPTCCGTDSAAYGINNLGDIVAGSNSAAFVDDAGVFTAISYPGASSTQVHGINDSGQIVGSYLDSGLNTHAFIATPVATPFPFTGFFPPVFSAPVLNVDNAGRSIPVRFSLSGNRGLKILAPDSPESTRVPSCRFTEEHASNMDPDTDTAGKSSLTYDPATDQYTYVWKTDKEWSGTCRKFILKLTDGTTHKANFEFR